MANMSYCRFENTSSDFCDCLMALYRAIDEEEKISEREMMFAESLYNRAKEYIDAYEELEEKLEE